MEELEGMQDRAKQLRRAEAKAKANARMQAQMEEDEARKHRWA